MRWFASLVLALALGVMGCSETSGTGGTAGDGGSGGEGGDAGHGGGGVGGTGGADVCEGVACVDSDCRSGGVCDQEDGLCDYDTVAEDGTRCRDIQVAGLGECLAGVCAPVGAFPCTEQGIRDAIAEGGGPQYFACDDDSTVFSEAEIVIDNDVILDGRGDLAVDGNEDHRLFHVLSGVSAELRGLKVTRGRAPIIPLRPPGCPIEPCPPSPRGGGILNGGTLTLVNVDVSENNAEVGVFAAGAGVFNLGTITIENSTISSNRACWSVIHSVGGRLTLSGSVVSDNGCDAIIFDQVAAPADARSEMSIVDSDVSDNDGSGISITGLDALPETSIRNSIVSGNGGTGLFLVGTADVENAVVHGNGGNGVVVGQSIGTVFFDRSTISGNSGAGIEAWGTPLEVSNCTVTDLIDNQISTLLLSNSTVSGVGIINREVLHVVNSTLSAEEIASMGRTHNGTFQEAETTLSGTIVRGACTEHLTSLGYNIESTGDTCGFDQATDQVDVSADDLKLGPLRDNGGPTMTHALGYSCPPERNVTIGVIPEQDCVDADGQALVTDQRGMPRVGNCDVGAYETQPCRDPYGCPVCPR